MNAEGIGIVYAPGLEPLLESGDIDLLEIEPQTLWSCDDSGRALGIPPTVLAWLGALPVPKIVHGVGAPVAGSVRAPRDFREAFARSVAGLGAAWASEHLNFNRVATPHGVRNAGFLFPPLQTEAGVRVAAWNVARMKAELGGIPFAIETPVSYLRPRPGEMSDGEFIARVAQAADCGIVLDLHNLWTNERNGRQPVLDFLAAIDLGRVWELHIAGGFEYRGYWLDAHSGTPPAEVMALADELVGTLPNLRAVILEVLAAYVPRIGIEPLRLELMALGKSWAWRRRAKPAARWPMGSVRPVRKPSEDDLAAVARWERELTHAPAGEGRTQEGSDPGHGIVRDLVWQFRAGAIADLLPRTIEHIATRHGEAFLRSTLDAHFDRHAPELFSVREALAFARSPAVHALAIPGLQAVAADDLRRLEALR